MRLHFDMERERSRELFKEVTNDNIDGHCHINFHSQIELYFVDEGQIDAFVNQQQRRLEKGQMAVALSYDAHLFRSVGNSRSSILVIPPDLCAEFISAVRQKQVQNPFICDEETVARIRFFVDAMKTDNTNEIKLRGYLYVVLGLVLENIFLKNTEFSVDTELSSKLLFHLNQQFRNEITLKSLSCTFGYSPSYLSRYFKDRFGIGLNQYINILRLRNALLLMQEGKNTHTHCAMESGFTSMRTFYRVFRQELGCAPRDYVPVLGSAF